MSNDAAHEPVVIAIDAGTTGVRAFAIDTDGPPRRAHVPGVHPALPPARLGRTRRGGDLGHHAHGARASCTPQLDRPVAAIGVTDQRETVVAWDRRTGRPRGTGRSCGRTVGPPRAATSWPPPASWNGCADSPAWCWIRTSRRPRWSGCCADGGVAADERPGVRHDRQLARVEPDRRRQPRHRSLQRQPHDALRHLRAPVVRRALRSVRRAARRRCREVRPRPASSAAPSQGSRAPPGHPDHRHRRRPAGLAVRPGMRAPGHGQEHLRHRVVRADEHRHDLPRARRGAAHHGRVAVPASMLGRPADDTGDPLRARGVDLRDRRRGAVAARRTGPDRRRRRGRAARRVGGRQRRAGDGARVHRSGLARTGTRTPAAPSWASPAASAGPTWPVPSSSRWRTRPATWSMR